MRHSGRWCTPGAAYIFWRADGSEDGRRSGCFGAPESMQSADQMLYQTKVGAPGTSGKGPGSHEEHLPSPSALPTSAIKQARAHFRTSDDMTSAGGARWRSCCPSLYKSLAVCYLANHRPRHGKRRNIRLYRRPYTRRHPAESNQSTAARRKNAEDDGASSRRRRAVSRLFLDISTEVLMMRIYRYIMSDMSFHHITSLRPS